MKTLTLSQRFWVWLCRFAFRRAAVPTQTPPTGLPGIRDPQSRCHMYAPRKGDWRDFGDCIGDGHYLCKECAHLKPEDPT